MNSGDRFQADEIALVPLDELGRRLTRVLDRLGTRRAAANIAGRSVDQLAKYEKGAVEPPFSGIAKLCLAAGVRMEWLATGADPMLTREKEAQDAAADWDWGLSTGIARRPEPAPQRASDADARAIEDREQQFLTTAVRIVDDVLHRYGYRAHTKPEEFAELVRIVHADLKRGAAEDAAAAALNRVLNIAREPHQP